MAQPEAYMLPRDASESQRLDLQHLWMKAISNNKLLHQTIPIRSVRAVADVATGTGVWIRDAASSWPSLGGRGDVDFVGFDISSSQFPNTETPNVRYYVHDATRPFPAEYKGKFDIVNVRLVSYAIVTSDLPRMVQNIADIIRPGGYLQWQECDVTDGWAQPDTEEGRKLVSAVVAERIARGLSPAIRSPLVSAIETATTPVPTGTVNPLAWTGQLLRIMQLQTTSTKDHPEPAVQEYTKPIILKTTTSMLQSGIERRKALAADRGKSWPESEEDRFMNDVVSESVGGVANGVQNPKASDWNCEISWIVARKAIFVGQNEAWMTARWDS